MARYLVTCVPKNKNRHALNFIVVLIEAETAKEAIEKSGIEVNPIDYTKPKAELAAFGKLFLL